MRAIDAFQITLKDEKIIEMDRHIKTLSGQLSELQTRLSSAEGLSSTLRGELDVADEGGQRHEDPLRRPAAALF